MHNKPIEMHVLILKIYSADDIINLKKFIHDYENKVDMIYEKLKKNTYIFPFGNSYVFPCGGFCRNLFRTFKE